MLSAGALALQNAPTARREVWRGHLLPGRRHKFAHLADSIGRSTSFILVGSHGLFGPRTSAGLIFSNFTSRGCGQLLLLSKSGTPCARDSVPTCLTFRKLADNSACAAACAFLSEDLV